MIVRAGGGWQTIIADLALILFMVSASALDPDAGGDKQQETASPLPVRGDPVGIYRAEPGALPLADWLDAQVPDPRLRLTIIARYPAHGVQSAAVTAAALAHQAGGWAERARIVVEPGERQELLAILAYDDAASGWHENCSSFANGGAKAAGEGTEPCE